MGNRDHTCSAGPCSARRLTVCLVAVLFFSLIQALADEPAKKPGPTPATGTAADDDIKKIQGQIDNGLEENKKTIDILDLPDPTPKPKPATPGAKPPPPVSIAPPTPPPAPPSEPPLSALPVSEKAPLRPLAEQSKIHFQRAQDALNKARTEPDPKMKQFYKDEARREVQNGQAWQNKVNRTIHPETSEQRRQERQAPTGPPAPHQIKPLEVKLEGTAWGQARSISGVDTRTGYHPEGFDGSDGPKRSAAPVHPNTPSGPGGPPSSRGKPPPPPGGGAISFAVKQPGGIKLSRVDADRVACALRFTSISYDPVRGTLLLAGDANAEQVDLSIITDCLRLAREDQDPFFSLDCVSVADWDGAWREFRHLSARNYPTDEARLQRLRKVCPQPQEIAGPQGSFRVYFAPCDVFDPQAWDEVERKRDLRMRMVFSPEWLRYSEVGWILYEADLAIKAIVAGYVEQGAIIRPAAQLWQIPGYVPDWLDTQSRDSHAGLAGRANLELGQSTMTVDQGRVDLSQIHPRIVIAHRRPGEAKDLPAGHPCQRCDRIKAHLEKHWPEYAARVPALARLDVVFRAYVASRFLLRQHPGLVARLEALPRRGPTDYPPLYHVHAGAVRLVEQGSGPETRTLDFQISGGYSGGVTLKTEAVQTQPGIVQVPTWLATTFPPSHAEESYQSIGSEAGVLLYFPAAVFSTTRQALSWLLFLAITAIAGVLVTRAENRRARPRADICLECLHTHRLGRAIGGCCDITAIASLAFLVSLPFLAAGQEATPTWMELGAAVATVAAVLVTVTVVAFLLQTGLRAIRHESARPGWVRRAGCGARWSGVALAVVLLANGIHERAVAERLPQLFGSEIGERLLMLMGGGEVIRAGAVVLIASAAVAFAARWIFPWLRGSRPLLGPLPAAALESGKGA